MRLYFTQLNTVPEEILARLRSKGWQPVHLPLRRVILNACDPNLELAAFDLVVISSKNAIHWLKQHALQNCPAVAVVGNASNALIEPQQRFFADTAAPPDAKALAAILVNQLKPDTRILLLQGQHARPTLATALKDYRTTVRNIYRTEPIPVDFPQLEQPGMVYFQAPSTVVDFYRRIPRAPQLIAAIGPTTAKQISAIGWPVHFQPSRPELTAFAEQLPLSATFQIARQCKATESIERTSMNTKSEALYERAVKLMPAGVNSPVRAFGSVGGTPLYMARGEGPYMFDADGKRYLDFCCSWGPLILGHAHPVVREAIERVVADGWTFGTPVSQEVDLASLIQEQLPEIEMMRFVNSGTEGVMSAIRLARGFTGRDRVLKFSGCYHGHVDYLLVDAGSGLATFGTASSAGVPQDFAKLTASIPLDDIGVLEEAFSKLGDELACVIIEGVPANNGLLIQSPAFIKRLRELCSKHGVLLIFDEVLVGFRMPEVMAYKHYDVQPDLVVMGKVIGGGMPVGAYGGRADIMARISPLGDVYQAGTLSGNPVAMAAGHATLKHYFSHDVNAAMAVIGTHLDRCMERALAGQQTMRYVRMGSLFWLYFHNREAPRTSAAIAATSAPIYAELHRFLLDRNIYLAPSSYEVGFLNAAMTTAHIEELADGIAAAKDQGILQ